MKPRKIRASNAWKKKSKAVRMKNPLCADPYGYHKLMKSPALSVDTHHIEALANNGQAFDESNLMPVCSLCHAALHGGRSALAAIRRAYTERGETPTGRGAFLLSESPRPTLRVLGKKIDGVFMGGGYKIINGVLRDGNFKD